MSGEVDCGGQTADQGRTTKGNVGRRTADGEKFLLLFSNTQIYKLLKQHSFQIPVNFAFCISTGKLLNLPSFKFYDYNLFRLLLLCARHFGILLSVIHRS